MIQKFLSWLVIGWLLMAFLALIGGLLSPLVHLLGLIVAILCIYGLLPPKLRIASVESWLGFDSNTDGGNNNTTATATASPKAQQPDLDFHRILSREEKLPEREQLKAQLNAQVIGQHDAVDTLVRVTLGKLAARKSTKPLVVFLPGPTGTGKTEISKALAHALNSKLVRFDMGEFAEQQKASNLFGSSKGYVGSEDGGALPNALRKSKNKCVILFDEVEKAHQSLWRQLLAFFDEGRISDTLGQVHAPKNTICILTSNIEAEKIAENPRDAKDIIKNCGYFPSEFLGRIDKIIPLLRLSFADTAKLATILTKKLADLYEISLIIEQSALGELMDAVSEEANKYGGRGIMEKARDLLLDDLMDLQAERISHAKLVKQGERLAVVPL